MEFGFLDLKSAAARLHMDELELKHFAQREEVPSQKRGDEYFFERSQLDEWAQRRMIGLHPKQLTGVRGASPYLRFSAKMGFPVFIASEALL